MGNIRLFGVSTSRLMRLREVAKEYEYAYDFGITFDAMADSLSDMIRECRTNQRFNYSAVSKAMGRIIFVGAPGVGYDTLAVLFSAASDIPLVDWDFFMEKPIVELIEAGIIKSKDEFRSQSSAGEFCQQDSIFDKTYEAMKYTSWIQWAEAVVKGNIPHCNAGKIFEYPDIVKFLKEKGFSFVKISVSPDEYIRVLNKYKYIDHHSNWQSAEKHREISKFIEKRWKESEDLFKKNKDLISWEIRYNDDPIEMIRDVVVSGF